MKSAHDLRAQQNDAAKLKASRAVIAFSSKVEAAVEGASKDGMHQVSVAVPDSLVMSIAPLGIGYEKLGYRVKIEKEMGWLGKGLYRRPATYLTLTW